MEPSLKKTLLGAVHQALGGDWRAAHLIAQDHEGEPLANWLHAVVHRMEGDVGNATGTAAAAARCGSRCPPRRS